MAGDISQPEFRTVDRASAVLSSIDDPAGATGCQTGHESHGSFARVQGLGFMVHGSWFRNLQAVGVYGSEAGSYLRLIDFGRPWAKA